MAEQSPGKSLDMTLEEVVGFLGARGGGARRKPHDVALSDRSLERSLLRKRNWQAELSGIHESGSGSGSFVGRKSRFCGRRFDIEVEVFGGSDSRWGFHVSKNLELVLREDVSLISAKERAGAAKQELLEITAREATTRAKSG